MVDNKKRYMSKVMHGTIDHTPGGLTKKNIKVIRPGKGLDARKFEDLLGKKSKKFMKLGSPLNFKVR